MSAMTYDKEAPHLEVRAPVARPAPIPDSRLGVLFDGDLNKFERRTPASASTSAAEPSVSCGPHNTTGVCQRYVDGTSNTTIPIVLGVVIPIAVALIILVILHRRHVKKLRIEDANDPHQSLDFGMDGVEGAEKRTPRNKKMGQEMSIAETKETLQRDRGLSMDMSGGNPYLLPPGLQQSRESIHSLSRALSSEDDRWSRAASYIPNDGSHVYPSGRRTADDSSSFTGSSRRAGTIEMDSSQGLIQHAQRMSTSMPPETSLTDAPRHRGQAQGQNGLLVPSNTEQVRDSYVSTASSNGPNQALRASNNYLGAFISGGFPSAEEQHKRDDTTSSANTTKASDIQPFPSVIEHGSQPQSQKTSPPNISVDKQVTSTKPEREPPQPQEDRNHVESMRAESPPPESQSGPRHAYTLPDISIGETSDRREEPMLPRLELPTEQDSDEDVLYEPHRSIGIRPLPPDDPSDNPEQRANRIRSFYKEYFEESKGGPKPAHQSYYDGSEEYADYGNAHDPAYDSAYEPAYDPTYDYNHHPGVEDYPRRTRTPPPRGPPRFMGTAHKPRSMSGGSMTSGRPNPYSIASGRGTPTTKKQLPPPAPLHVLPTPHMLKDDNIMLNLPIDFAPPNLTKVRRAGTPDSLRGGSRPYSPALPAHIPLTSSFDDLAAIPSPHLLRKSGTFTSLDFAPSPRFAQSSTASDAGSIRSNRTAMSAQHVHNIRKGAYRVSRIPKDLSGTKNEMTSNLKPQWGMRP